MVPLLWSSLDVLKHKNHMQLIANSLMVCNINEVWWPHSSVKTVHFKPIKVEAPNQPEHVSRAIVPLHDEVKWNCTHLSVSFEATYLNLMLTDLPSISEKSHSWTSYSLNVSFLTAIPHVYASTWTCDALLCDGSSTLRKGVPCQLFRQQQTDSCSVFAGGCTAKDRKSQFR